MHHDSNKTMPPPGIEPGSPVWEADVLPLSHGAHSKNKGENLAIYS